MDNIIYRDDKQYIEIENFKNYELLNNIIFEMAIRNKDLISLLTEFYITKKDGFSQLDVTSIFICKVHLEQRTMTSEEKLNFQFAHRLLQMQTNIEKLFYIHSLIDIE